MPELPRDLRSRDITRALERLGFVRGPASSGSHQSYHKRTPTLCYVVVVPEGKKAIPVGTLNAIIKQAGVTRQQFLDALAGK